MALRVLLGLVLASACAHPQAAPPAAPAPPTILPPEDSLTLARTACSGHCPVYSVTLHPDGRVHFVGEADVAALGARDWRIEPAFATHLLGEIDRAKLSTLAPRYATEVEEFPGLVLSFTRNGQVHRVQLGGEDSADAPRDLAVEKLLLRLALTIDKLVGDARFVTTDPKRRGDGCVE